jgi:hypothetical protein
VRTEQEIKADIERWDTGVSRNRYIVRALNEELRQVQKGEPSKPEPEPEKKAEYTEELLFKMNKKQQVEILEKLGAEEVPRYEKARVALILKLSK